MADEDEEQLFDDPFADDPDPDDDAAAKAKAAQAREDKVRGVIEKERAKHEADQAALLGALRSAWGSEAAARFPLASLDQVALTGIDDEAKGKFLAEVEARHVAEEARLAAAGYVRTDAEGNPIIPAAPTAGEQQDAAAAAQWGAPVGGSDTSKANDNRAEVERAIVEAARQGPAAVIREMFGRTDIKDRILARRGGGGS